MMRGRSLAVRLALLLAGVLVVVLLLAGFVVNRAASRSLDETLGPRERERLALAGAFVEESLRRGVGERGMDALVRRIARDTGGAVRVVDASGTPIAEGGHLPPGIETDSLTTELAADVGGGALEIEVPAPGAPFLRAFNGALLITGAVAVVAMLAAAALAANRLTRPLREVAGAARRLGHGDLTARARGGPDAESAELATAFNGMAERLERSEALRRRAASDLAHDLATPATVLESQVQAMVDGVVPADAAQLEKARVAAAGLSSLIGQLSELTQAEAAPLQRNPEPVDLAVLAREIVDANEGLLREHGVTAAVEADGAVTAIVDRAQVARALRNVLTNAVVHSPRGGTVRIGLDAGPPIAVRIADQGSGIDADDLPFIFERFYRADRSRGRVPGSGIGLTVARELVTANGGTVEVESTGPGGTTFRIGLSGG
jgi:two-component system, OmpR family, sensor histidine kinase BaeS